MASIESVATDGALKLAESWRNDLGRLWDDGGRVLDTSVSYSSMAFQDAASAYVRAAGAWIAAANAVMQRLPKDTNTVDQLGKILDDVIGKRSRLVSAGVGQRSTVAAFFGGFASGIADGVVALGRAVIEALESAIRAAGQIVGAVGDVAETFGNAMKWLPVLLVAAGAVALFFLVKR